MAINEEKLLQSGFTPSDLQKLKRYLVKNELTLDMVVSDLSRRFQAAILLTAGIMAIFIAILFLASKENVISSGIAIFFVLLIVWFFQPPVLAWKSWNFRKKQFSGKKYP